MSHPAKYSATIIAELKLLCHDLLPLGASVLDPFGGVGGIHQLQPSVTTYCIEIEQEWAWVAAQKGFSRPCDFFEFYPEKHLFFLANNDEQGVFTQCVDSPLQFDAIISSPTYGNRFSDHHTPKDGSKRHSYKFDLGRDLTVNNSGAMNWFSRGKYQQFHQDAYKKFWDLLRDDGYVFLNVSDFIAKKEIVPASEWHKQTMLDVGFTWVRTIDVPTPRMRYGANNGARVEAEQIHTFTKDAQ